MDQDYSPHGLYPYTSSAFKITKEQFDSFYSTDRAMYSMLVFALGRDPVESMQVMGLWLWLERYCGRSARNFVHKLRSFPYALVNNVADESVTSLKCVENDWVQMGEYRDENDIPILHSILGGGINLNFFCENRVSVLVGVNKILNEVCLRAFEDILLSREKQKSSGSGAGFVGEGSSSSSSNVLEEEVVGELLGKVSLQCEEEEKEKQIREIIEPPEQRTIFLTFSKGYPTSESEVRDFFTRRHGDVIEVIHMQELSGEAQSLYARLVVRSGDMISVVLGGQNKAKFNINGKHVWARKFVKKHHHPN